MPANPTDLPTGGGDLPPGGGVPLPPPPPTPPCRTIIIVVAVIVFLITLLFPRFLPPEPVTTILLIRHAEKVDNSAGSLLTGAGTARANELVHVARQAGIQKIYATEFVRTQLTVQPLATALGLPVDTTFPAQNVPGLVGDILANHRGQTVLVAHHSNGIPDIVQRLGGLPVPPIDDATEFDRLHVIHHHSREVKVTLLRYFAPLPP